MGGLAVLGAFAVVIGLWLYMHRMAPKLCTFLFLLAGLSIGGWLGGLLGSLINTVLGTVGSVTGQVIGYGASTILAAIAFVAILEVFVKGLWKKKAKPQRWHPWLALALPTIVVAFGLPIMVEAFTAFTDLMESAGSSISAGGE